MSRTTVVAVLMALTAPVAIAGEDATDRIRGLVVPLDHARLSSLLAANIERIGPEAGESFKAGDVLVQFDCETYEAERTRAEADLMAADASFANKREMVSKGAAGRIQVQLAEAERKRARAQRDIAQKQIEGCKVTAPYDGRVVQRIANAHETVGPRDLLIEITGDTRMELRAYVRSTELSSMGVGTRLTFAIDETGESIPARVIALGARIDNVAQLIEVRAEFEAPARKLIPGMSGTVRSMTGLARAP